MAHTGFGSYGVMLLALAILLLGVAVLAVTWRRERAARPFPGGGGGSRAGERGDAREQREKREPLEEREV